MSYERKDASLAIIGVSAGILLAVLWGSIWLAAAFYRARSGATRGIPTAGRQTSFTLGPEREADSLRSWQAVQAEARQLDRYGWIDRKEGIARIPIGRAVQLVAAGARPMPFPPASSVVKEAEAIQNRTLMPNLP